MKQIIIITSLFFVIQVQGQQAFKRVCKLMGSRFDITVVANSKKEADNYIDAAVAEITRIENLISSWDPKSQTSLINKNAGIGPVKVDKELYDLIDRALKISKLTDGAFDISYASMDRIWKFDGSMKEMPRADMVKASIARVGYQQIVLDKENHSVYLPVKGMKIGFGGIGKGYAADKAKELLIAGKVPSGIINASGDMNTWGKQPNGDPWQVGITNPSDNNKVFALLPLDNSSVVTSGNYEKFVTFNDIRYSHIIDPRTGYPSSGLISVSVFTKNAELADALATSIFVMGKEVGLNLINQLKGIECILVDDQGKVFNSKGIDIKKLKKN